MRRMRAIVVAVMLAAVVWTPATLSARESNGTRAARAHFAKGDAAAQAGRLAEAVAAFRRAIDADPDFVDAHQRFIEVTQRMESPSSRTTPCLAGPSPPCWWRRERVRASGTPPSRDR